MRFAADAVVLLHLAFVIFAVAGGLLVLWSRRWAFVHLPAVAWAGIVEIMNWVCPLTPFENQLRVRAGQAGYPGGFVEHYVIPLLYPEALPREIQVLLGVAVVLLNVCVYAWVWRRSSKVV